MDREDEETTRRRVLLELEAKEAFEYRKRLTADRLKAVPIYNRERDPATLTDFLLKLSDAWKHCFPIDGEAAKLVFLRQRCSPSMGEWMNSLVPKPTSAQEWLEAIQKEHGVEDEEAAARTALSGLRLVGPYTETSFHDHTAAFDRLLPRIPTMDYISLRDVFYSTIPRDLHRKIFDQTIRMHLQRHQGHWSGPLDLRVPTQTKHFSWNSSEASPLDLPVPELPGPSQEGQHGRLVGS